MCLALPTMQAKKVVDPFDLTLEQNLEQPEVKNDKQSDRIAAYQHKVAVQLIEKRYNVEVMRDEEIVVVTIPAGALFAANDTTLTPVGDQLLKPFLKYLKPEGYYKILLVMHSDNTGSEAYTIQLTRSRVNAIFDWFEAHGSTDFVVPYALGDSDPVVDNNSFENRKKNRRLEIYLVPEQVMIEQAKKGNLK